MSINIKLKQWERKRDRSFCLVPYNVSSMDHGLHYWFGMFAGCPSRQNTPYFSRLGSTLTKHWFAYAIGFGGTQPTGGNNVNNTTINSSGCHNECDVLLKLIYKCKVTLCVFAPPQSYWCDNTPHTTLTTGVVFLQQTHRCTLHKIQQLNGCQAVRDSGQNVI